MFYPRKIGGLVRGWEYLPASAGTYHAGQLLNVADGKLVSLGAASAVTPPYLCQCDRAVADGEIIPVVRVSYDDIYESKLGTDTTDIQIGKMLQICKGGETVDGNGAGSFEVVSFEGTAADSIVCGRFHVAGAGGVTAATIATDEEVQNAIDETFAEGA